MATSTSKKRLLIGASAIAAAAALAPQAQAATLYIANSGGTIYQFPNAGYVGSTIAASTSNSFATVTSPTDVALDSAGNIVAVTDSGTSGGAYVYSPSGGSSIASLNFGDGNYHEALFNNTLYVTQYTNLTSNKCIIALSYTYSGSTPTFGSPTTLSTGSSTNHGYGVAVAPASTSLGNGSTSANTSNYLFFSYASGSSSFVNTLNLSNSNSLGTALAVSGTTNLTGLTYDPYNGDIYGVGLNTDYIYKFTPTYSSGSISGIGQTTIALAAGSSTFDLPTGLTFGPDGNLYITDQGNGDIYSINVDGISNGTTTNQLDTYITGTGNPYGLVFTPEPATLGLMSLGAGAMLLRRRRSHSVLAKPTP